MSATGVSKLDDKKNVFALLKDKVKEYGGEFNIDSNKVTILNKVKAEMEVAMKDTLIASSFPDEYHRYEIFVKTWKTDHFAKSNQLLEGTLRKFMMLYINNVIAVHITRHRINRTC